MPSPMGQSAVDCGDLSSMPSVSFTIGDKVFDLAPEEVNIKYAQTCTRTSIDIPQYCITCF